MPNSILDYLTKKVGPKANPNDPLWMDLAKTYGLMDKNRKANKFYDEPEPDNSPVAGPSMRAATGMDRFRDTIGSGLNSLSQQPLARVGDATGMTNFQQVAEGFNQPRPEVLGAALPFGPPGAGLAKKFSGGPIARSVANDIGVPKKPPIGPDAESLAEIAENEAMLKRILGESAVPAPIQKPVAPMSEVDELIAQLTGKPASAVPKVTNVDMDSVIFKNNGSGDAGGVAGSIEESNALQKVINNHPTQDPAYDRPLLVGRDAYGNPSDTVGRRRADGSWELVESGIKRKGKM